MTQTDEIPLRALMVYTYVCHVSNGWGRFLLIQRAGPVMEGVWQPVTGRVKSGEAGWQTALREMQEETGLRPDRFYSANHVEMFYEPNWECIALAPVFVAIVINNSEPEVVLSEEHRAYQWCTAQKACDFLLFPQQQDTIRYIDREFLTKNPPSYLHIDI